MRPHLFPGKPPITLGPYRPFLRSRVKFGRPCAPSPSMSGVCSRTTEYTYFLDLLRVFGLFVQYETERKIVSYVSRGLGSCSRA